MSMERRKGSNKVLYKEALAQGQRLIHFTVFLTGKALLSHTCSFLSEIPFINLMWLIRSYFWDK